MHRRTDHQIDQLIQNDVQKFDQRFRLRFWQISNSVLHVSFGHWSLSQLRRVVAMQEGVQVAILESEVYACHDQSSHKTNYTCV